MKDPREEPILVMAEFIDINVPRFSETCSRIRLFNAERPKPMNNMHRNRAALETQRAGRIVYAAVDNPPNRLVVTITGFPPYLFTSLAEPTLPRVKKIASPITNNEALLLEIRNVCL